MDRCRAGGGDIDHAGIGQLVLQAQARPALLRGLRIAALALGPCGIGHGMAFIEQDYPIEILPQPVDDLIDAGLFCAPLLGAQRGIGGEQNALGERDILDLRKARQGRDEQPLLAER